MDAIVTLNVGGSICFRATKATLLSVEGYFSNMLDSEVRWKESSDFSQPIFIDRDPEVFPGILTFLRTQNTTFLSKEDDIYLKLLLIEADFYSYPQLTTAIYNEQERRKFEQEQRQASTQALSNNTTYKIVSENEVSMWFDRGWAFASQYYGNESYGCPVGPSYRVANFENRGTPRCSACNESMHYERFLKHTVLFKPCMFVIAKKFLPASRSSSLSVPLATSVGGTLVDDILLANMITEAATAAQNETDGLVFDQSFG